MYGNGSSVLSKTEGRDGLKLTGEEDPAGLVAGRKKRPLVERERVAGGVEARTAGPCCGIPSRNAGTHVSRRKADDWGPEVAGI